MKSASDLLLDLIAIPSVSSMSNQPVIDYVTSCLPARQWRIEPHGYLDAAGVGKTNLVALSRNANQNHAELAFVRHTDTVPYQGRLGRGGEAGSFEMAAYPRRGCCDVKGFLACVLTALNRTDVTPLSRPLALTLTADEEVGCVGAKLPAAENAVSTALYDHRRAHRSSSHFAREKATRLAAITVRGRKRISALPSEGHSAIYDAVS